jgi:phospholipid/cholesterol/gamma-HCH transport system substrate-binding protein
MKSESGNKIRLGIFVSIAIGLFIVVIYYIGNKQNMFTKTITVNGIFSNVEGLQAGNNVRFTGINVGTIKDIVIITDSTVQVEMVIKEDVQKFIKDDAMATIGTEGLMGNKVINLIPGSPDRPMIKDGGSMRTVTPVSMDDIMASLQVTATNAAYITEDIAAVTGGMRTGEGAIGRLLVDTTFAKNLDQTLVNARNATDGLNQNMEAAKENFLLKGYFKKKEKEAEKAKKEAEKAAEEKKKPESKQ